MYKLIIVEDEYLIRESLAQTIDWSELGVEVVGLAANGCEALRLVEELKPEIVLSDIRMPIMDGIELARKLKETYLQISIIFISSYDEFSYAQQAIKIGVDDYVLKPIDNEKVKDSIHKVIESMEREKIRQDDFKRLEADLRESLAKAVNVSQGEIAYFHKMLIDAVKLGKSHEIILLTDKFLTELKTSGITSRDSLQRKCIELLVKFSNTFSCDQFVGEEVVKMEDETCSNILESDTVDEIKNTLIRYFTHIIEMLSNMKTDKNLVIVVKSKEYVAKHLHRDISLEEVAEAVELSPNYFSSIFKKQTGMSLGGYILREKMEKARDYLLTTNLKIYEISEKVGFNDSKYFCTVFKKYFKIAPSEMKNG